MTWNKPGHAFAGDASILGVQHVYWMWQLHICFDKRLLLKLSPALFHEKQTELVLFIRVAVFTSARLNKTSSNIPSLSSITIYTKPLSNSELPQTLIRSHFRPLRVWLNYLRSVTQIPIWRSPRELVLWLTEYTPTQTMRLSASVWVVEKYRRWGLWSHSRREK